MARTLKNAGPAHWIRFPSPVDLLYDSVDSGSARGILVRFPIIVARTGNPGTHYLPGLLD